MSCDWVPNNSICSISAQVLLLHGERGVCGIKCNVGTASLEVEIEYGPWQESSFLCSMISQGEK